jgi:hypothetical protein
MEHAPELAATIIFALIMLSIFASVLILFVKVAVWFVMIGLLLVGAFGIVSSGGAWYLIMIAIGYYLFKKD